MNPLYENDNSDYLMHISMCYYVKANTWRAITEKILYSDLLTAREDHDKIVLKNVFSSTSSRSTLD